MRAKVVENAEQFIEMLGDAVATDQVTGVYGLADMGTAEGSSVVYRLVDLLLSNGNRIHLTIRDQDPR